VNCAFDCPEPILVPNNAVATHLYRIAQEAINNAIKHGKATKIKIGLRRKPGAAELAIHANGTGFPKELKNDSGMGLQIMKYRAGMIGGALEIQPTEGKGSAVVCAFKADS
jgi:signal transduction histidine kinase